MGARRLIDERFVAPMRVPALILTLVLTALLASACGGPENNAKELTAACERQIEEIAELDKEQQSTPVAPSTDERLAKTQLVECAGQPANQTAVVDAEAGGEGDAKPAEGDAKPAEGDAEGDAKDETEPAADEPAELDPAARELFVASCGGCHALSDAETTGAVFNLDETKMDAEAVTNQILNGGNGMPAGLLTGEDAESIGTYVAGAAAAE